MASEMRALSDTPAYLVSPTSVQIAGVVFTPQDGKTREEMVETAARIVGAWNSYLGVSLTVLEKGHVAAIGTHTDAFAKAVVAGKVSEVPKLAKAADKALDRVWGEAMRLPGNVLVSSRSLFRAPER